MSKSLSKLSEKAEITKPEQLSVFLYYRALGKTKKRIAKITGFDRKTLYNWEKKLEENLSVEQRAELVLLSVESEHEKIDYR
jgi:transposase